MQSVSAGFTASAAAAQNNPTFSALVSWLKTFTSGAGFFTIGTSSIGGADSIKGPGGVATFLDKYDYLVETPNVNSLTIQRSISAIPVGVMSGQLDIELNNSSSRYLPGFDGTIGNYIKPGRPIKVNVGFDAEQVPLFAGFTGRPMVSVPNRTATLHAYDGMAYLNNFQSSLAMQTNIKTDALLALLLAEAGFTSSQYSLEASLQLPIAFVAPTGQKTGDLIDKVVSAENGMAFFDEQGIFHFWNRLHFDLNSTSVATLNYSNLVGLDVVDTPVINDVIVTSKPRAVTANQLVWRLSTPFVVGPGQTVVYPANFSDDDGALPVSVVDTPVYIDSQITSFYKTNTASDNSGSTSQSNISLSSSSNVGTAYLMSFTNSSTTTPMWITDIQLYGTPAKVVATYQQEYQDTASITDNGVNPDNNGVPLPINNDYIQDATTALAYATNVVQQFSQPRRQFNLQPLANPAFQFGDVISVFVDDLATTTKMVVFGTKLSMSPSQLIGQTLTAEGRVFRSLFTIGTSSIGGLDAIPA